MNLRQLRDLRRWQQSHPEGAPIERHAWEVVLTLWLIGCVGVPVAFVLAAQFAGLVCIVLIFLPGGYVALRERLHRTHRLRCDWIVALR